jgi:putative membrane protein
MMGYGGYEGFGVIHAIFSIFWAVFLVAIIITAVRWLKSGKSPWHHMGHHCWGNAALDILSERYAKGEINKEEFEERRKVLGGY